MTSRISIVLVLAAATFVAAVEAIVRLEASMASTDARSPQQLVAAGQGILTRSTTACLVCHSLGADANARCPDFRGLGARAGERRAGMTSAAYIAESVYNPNAFAVAGYPSGHMPPANRPPIALADDEIAAVAAYLNSLGGTTDERFVAEFARAQRDYRDGTNTIADTRTADTRFAMLPGDPIRGRTVFDQKAACVKCHRMANEGPDNCPDLTAIGRIQGPEYILESIVAPNAVTVKGYKQSRIVVRDGPGGTSTLTAVITAWIPSEEEPQRVRIKEITQDKTTERELPVTTIDEIGDTVVVTKDRSGNLAATIGYVVKGDPKSGLTLRALSQGRWVQKPFAPDTIVRVNPTLSPMPGNFGDQLSVQETYDLVAYVASAKGQPNRKAIP